MTGRRWVVLGLAHPRAAWFSELARWSTSATLPIDFIKCMSVDEVRTRLGAGRPYSTLMVGGRITNLDRDLTELAAAAGTAVIVVDPVSGRDWVDLGVAGVIHSPFSRDDLLATLEQHSTPVEIVASNVELGTSSAVGSWRGRLVAVTGPGGAGKSTAAMALSQTLADGSGNREMVLLADLALNGEQAMLHDARDLVPGIQELVDAHRTGRMTVDRTRSMVFNTGSRGYNLLLGLRRHRDWTVLRPRSFDAALDALLRSHRIVVADVTADVEGETQTGSTDIADRNLMARTTLDRADLIVAVGAHGLKGIHSLANTIRELLAHGVAPHRLIPVVNRAPRSPAQRADDTQALAALVASTPGSNELPGPLFVPDRKDLESALRDGARLPTALGSALGQEIERRLDDTPSQAADRLDFQPELVVPGSIGTWTEEAG